MRASFALLVGVCVISTAWAMEPPPGATTCSGCHGGEAMATINGRSAKYLVSTMEAFRAGDRRATIMNRLVKGFTPEEVQAIAAWIAEQK